ncbi:zinc finger CW-type PWWP domain protein 2 [Macrochelys suwanniensis]
MDTRNENHFYLDKVWVQCEIGSCLKWRLLSSDDAAQVDHSEPWYCYMNTDPWFNNCSVSEEYFPEESEFNKNGFKYVYSEFPIGSLVLVKMRSWPRWPGVLCPDPLNGQYVTYDLDGYVENNHVEFLGDPHSRGWVAVKYISRYPSSIKVEQCKRKKKWYKSALEEANKLLAFSPLQRLEMCQLSENALPESHWVPDSMVQTVFGRKLPEPDDRTCSKKSQYFALQLDESTASQLLGYVRFIKAGAGVLEDKTEASNDTVVSKRRVTKCSTESTEGSPMENYTQEDCIIIDGIAFRAGECIENITNKFKEIDSLMAEFQDSL